MIHSNRQATRIADKLDRTSLIPLYHQLYEILRAKIDNGDWNPGDMIPPESELQKHYEVSQITVRKALNTLVDQGLIVRRRGKGTFLAKRRIDSNLSSMIDFDEDMEQRGMKPRTVLIATSHPTISTNTASMLEIDIDEEITLISRLRYADDEPLSMETSILVSKYVPGILKNDFTKRSLRETLLTDYGIELVYAQQTISGAASPRRYCQASGYRAGRPAIDHRAAQLFAEQHADRVSPNFLPCRPLRFPLRIERQLRFPDDSTFGLGDSA